MTGRIRRVEDVELPPITTTFMADEFTDDEVIELASEVLAEMGIRKLDARPVVEVRSVLMEAEDIVNGHRRNTYGTPENNFARIADLWNAYLLGKPGAAMPITPQDVALLMVLMKVARLLESPNHRDSVVDICGYAATVEMLWTGK